MTSTGGCNESGMDKILSCLFGATEAGSRATLSLVGAGAGVPNWTLSSPFGIFAYSQEVADGTGDGILVAK